MAQSASADTSRRDFLKVSAVAGASLTALAVAPAVHAAGGDTLKIGLIGCGNRGTGAAAQALNADANASCCKTCSTAGSRHTSPGAGRGNAAIVASSASATSFT